jgi:hypothetical protein
MGKKGLCRLAVIALISVAASTPPAPPVPKGGTVLVAPPEAYDPKLHHDVIDEYAPRPMWSIILTPQGKPFPSKEKCDVLVASLYRVAVMKATTNPSAQTNHDLKMAKLSRCVHSDGSASFVPGVRHLNDVHNPHVDRIGTPKKWPF